MRKIITLLFFLLCSCLSFGQSISLKGKVTDTANTPLESATIYLTSVKDSTVIDYTISDRNGNWEIKSRKITQPVFLKISFISFTDYKKELASVEQNIDLGTIVMQDQSTELGELVIVGETPPIRIKSDTLEFNASSFKVRPDANVEALLKQLPGVEVDNEGKITVNGKEVNQILVNGKPFFDKDGKVALQNLPAEIINKVQVTDTKTKVEELSGQKASSNNASINLTIQEDKNKGLFGKFMGGYGTNERYESSGLINYFKDKRKISFLGSSNNINSTGFSMDEIFDNMGGGRSVYYNSNGGFGINGMQFGGAGSGITISNMIGVNYADEWFKGFDSNANYFYTSSDTENNNRTKQQNFLPEVEDANNPGTFINNNFTRESISDTDTNRYAHNFNTEFEFKIDSTSTLQFSPKLARGNSKSKSTSRQFSTDENNQLLNESDAYTFDESDNTNFSNNLYYNKVFGKRGRTVGVYFNNQNNKDESANLNRSTTSFYEDTNSDGIIDVRRDIRDQVRNNRQTSDSYDTGFHYFEPVLDSLKLKVALNYKLNKSIEDREGYNFDPASGKYSSPEATLTNYLSSTTSTAVPSAGLTLEKNKFSVDIDMGTAITQFNNYSFYMGNATTLNKTYLLPSLNLYGNYRFSKAKSLYFNYSYDVIFPQAQQVLPVEDLSNPLYSTIGNPDLNPNKTHSIFANFRNYDYATRSGFSFYGGIDINDSEIISSTVYDQSAKSTTTYQNVSGTYNGWSGLNWSKSIKMEAHTIRLSGGLSTRYDFQKGFTNGQLFESRNISLTPRANISWDYGELLSINPSYRFSYSENNYTNYSVNSASTFVHTFNLQTTSYWPKHFVFGNDFGYTYNSRIADGFRKDFYLWNTSLGYNFYNDQLLFKVKVYDVLNQNLATSRTISATTIRDEENTVLKRYVMFSLTYKISKFGAKKEEKKSRFMQW